jgi:Domain of unknown function (DUF1906)
LAALAWRPSARPQPRPAGRPRVGALALWALLASWICWTSGTTALAAKAGKVVRYRGYRIVVPASWPVYDLHSDPSVCVRFNRHAVYLGQPSSAQRCPAHAVGRTEAILIEPLAARGADTGESAGAALSSVSGNEAQPPQGSSTRLVVPRAGVIVTATWDADPAALERVLGMRLRPTTRAGEAVAARAAPPEARAASAAAGGVYTGLGFDACSAPSTAAMAAWGQSPYRAVGVYIGGTNMACSQPNLTAAWVGAQTAAGWRLIPTYIGLQAPDNSCGCSAINPRRASAEGAAAARDAVAHAEALEIGPGSPIYYDMEDYPRGGSNTSAVLSFLAAWTSGLHAAGYQSGVYGNGDSAISDLVAARDTGYPEPDDIWFAEWNGERNTVTPYVPAGEWNDQQRLHQYDGGHNETYGGVRINIDGDFLDGASAGASTADAAASIPDGTFVQVAGLHGVYKIAGGAPLFVSTQYWQTVSGSQPLTAISPQQFALLNPVPAEGTFLEDSTGALYRVAGGAPLLVSERSLFENAQPVTVDHWDIANIANPAAHLNSVPANGTFLTTTTGSVWRVAGGAPFAITTWSLFGGVRPSVTVDQWDLSNVSNPEAHLNAKPLNGTIVEGLPSRSYWVFSGGTRRLTSANAAAVQVDDIGLAAFPALPCVVPRLRRLTLAQARHALQRADCRLGEVEPTMPARRSRTLHVLSQTPRPRATEPAGAPVNVALR